MKDLLILGGCVHSGEMVEIVERINRVAPTWNLLGFVVREGRQASGELNGVPFLGGPEVFDKYPNACLAPEFEWPRSAEVLRDRLVSLIDPSAVVSRTASIGVGSVIYPGCFVGLNARIGDFVFCLSGCTVNHDDVIEDRCALASGVTLAGGVHVEADCYLGQCCAVRQNLRIGSGSLIGMGAVVVKSVPPNSVMVGNPARWLKNRR